MNSSTFNKLSLADRYLQRPQGSRLTRAAHYVEEMHAGKVSILGGVALLLACAEASRHFSQHAIDLHSVAGPEFLDSNVAVSMGGVTSRQARKKAPFVGVLSPENITIQKLT